jgi:predicted branched-subunit amino acid permease
MIGVAERSVEEQENPRGDAIKHMMPAAIGVLPFATMIGVAIGDSPMSEMVGFVGGLVIAGGSAHLAATTSITVGAGLFVTVATALLIHARGLIYSAALAPAMRSQPRWFRWVAAYGLVDQMFVLASAVADRSREYVRTYYIAAMTLLWTAYIGGVGVGLLAGPVIPPWIPLGISIPVIFLVMLVPTLDRTPAHAAAIVGMTVAALGSGLPSGFGLIVGIAAGTVAGVVVEAKHA